MQNSLILGGVLIILPVISCGLISVLTSPFEHGFKKEISKLITNNGEKNTVMLTGDSNVYANSVQQAIEVSRLFRTDYHFSQESFGWLKYHRMPLTWEEAVLTCHFEDAVLASPLGHGIRKELCRLMTKYDVTDTPMFTGISNVYSNSVYQSMEGIPVSNIKLPWSSEPRRHDSKICIALNQNETVTEVSCGDRYPFACYKKDEIKVTKGCGTVDKGYVLNDRTESCYKLYSEKHTWPEAYRICAADGGHLAIVNSQAEAEVIWDMGVKSGSAYALAIGFHEWGHERTWLTIQGQSLKDAGYDKWYPGEPNILTENCGGFMTVGSAHDNGILADLPCDVKVLFICEIDP